MEAPIQQTQVGEGQTEITSVPQETVINEPPQIPATPQVERVQPTSQEPPAQDPYETARQIKNLVKEFRALKQSFNTRPQETAPNVPQTLASPQVPITKEELLADPLSAIRKIAAYEADVRAQTMFQTQQQMQANMMAEQARQEGLKLIKTNEFIKRDPEGEDRMKEILLEEDSEGNSLEKYAQLNPKHAAQLALREYQSRYGQGKSGAVPPSKGQMASTATAQSSGSGRGTTAAEIGALYAQVAAMPELMNDPAFAAKMNAILQKSDVEDRLVRK